MGRLVLYSTTPKKKNLRKYVPGIILLRYAYPRGVRKKNAWYTTSLLKKYLPQFLVRVIRNEKRASGSVGFLDECTKKN